MAKIVQYPDKDGNRAYALTHWQGVIGKPDIAQYYTREEVNALLANQSNEKISPDGTVWVSSISDEGVLMWDRKEETSERKQDK